jgi:hypothetical protein
MEMFQKGDKDHLDAMNEMKELTSVVRVSRNLI